MATFINDRAAVLWNATAVSNAFFCEYMPSAPDGYVKVYLYGLMAAHEGVGEDERMVEDVAKTLGMTGEEVEKAMRYWERCRLVERVKDNPPQYRYLSVQQAAFLHQQTQPDQQYEDFAQALYALFGDKRKLHGGETVLAYEWVEQLGLSPEVVLMLVRHMISTRGLHFGFKEAQKIASEMSAEKINTLEAAEMMFSRSESAWKGARKVLSRLGKRRSPSMDEVDLYMKWTTRWGFAPKAIEAACAETTKGDPSFAYLDKILEGIHQRSDGKATTADKVEKLLSGEKDESARVREMLTAFGMKAPVVDEGIRLVYRAMCENASHEVVVLAARQVGKRRGAHSLDQVGELVEAWDKRGLKTTEDVEAYLKNVAQQDKTLRSLFVLMGKEKELTCSQANRELLRKWREDWRISEPLVQLAAAYARNVDHPMAYADKLLTSWREKDITTVAEAQQEHEEHTAAAGKKYAVESKPAPGAKRVLAQQYEQREYNPDDVNDMSPEDLEEASKL
ncbi:MAG: DnaD domain protein [Clostridiales bacterium]|nr:DnaD domain protein [Clostridiales bacterium]